MGADNRQSFGRSLGQWLWVVAVGIGLLITPAPRKARPMSRSQRYFTSR